MAIDIKAALLAAMQCLPYAINLTDMPAYAACRGAIVYEDQVNVYGDARNAEPFDEVQHGDKKRARVLLKPNEA